MYQKLKYPFSLVNSLAVLILLVALFFPLSAKAQTQDIVNQQDWITRQQQIKIEKNRRLREQKAISKEKTRKEKEVKAEEATSISAKPVECFSIKTINLVGANSISKRQQKKLLKLFIGQCSEPKILAEVIATIKAYYEDRGYIATGVSLSEQNSQGGDLELKVSEEKIDKIIINDNSFTDKMQQFTAFGNIEGDALNLKDLDQGVSQMNRLSSNNASIKKLASSAKEGEAIVYIANEKSFPANATIGYDSLGNEYTGVYRTSFSGEIDNLLFLNDALNLSYTANLNSDRKVKDNKAFTGDFSIPFGYNTFTYDYSRSEFMRVLDIGTATGYSNSNSFTIDRVLTKKGDFTISGDGSLTTKSAASYLDHQKIDISERKLTIASIEFALSNSFKNGTSLYVKPTYSRGLKILDAKKDNQDLSSNSPRAQFERFKLYATLSKKITIPKLEIPVLLATEMDSQFSNDVLFGSEQFSVGGYYSVRGFRDSYLTGDTGYYFRNSADFNVGSLIRPFNSQYWAYLNKFKIEPFYDYGYAQIKHSGNSGRLAGAGVKTIFESKYFNASLTYSAVTSRSQLLSSSNKENKIIYFEISASCC